MKKLNLKTMKRFTMLAAMAGIGLTTISCNDDDNVDFDDDGEVLFVSSNTSGRITAIDVSDIEEPGNPIEIESYGVQAMDADGIFYSDNGDVIYQINRTSSVLNAYQDISDISNNDNLSPSATSSSNFGNGREIAVSNGQAIVADDATDTQPLNRLAIYSVTPTAIDYQKTINVSVNLWGIQLVGNDLYAISDNTSDIVLFRNVFSNADGALVNPDKTVTVEGIVRTHGLIYDSNNDVAVLTDVGSGMVDDDGAFTIINGFANKFNTMDMIPLSDQIRVAGSNTFLGNPVDVDYDHDRQFVHIAERANAGGRVLMFQVPTSSGNFTPSKNEMVAGASAVFLQR